MKNNGLDDQFKTYSGTSLIRTDILSPTEQNTVEPAITATLYNGHLSISVTNEQSRPKFHNIEPVYSGHLLNAASGHPFVVPY